MGKQKEIIQHLIFLPAREPAANFKINGESGFTPVCVKSKKIKKISLRRIIELINRYD